MPFGDLIADVDHATQDHLGSVAVTYTPDVGPAVTETPSGDPLVGMFDENFILSDPDRPGIEMVAPVVTLRLEDLPTDPRDEDNVQIKILGIDYTVDHRITDGSIGGSIRLLRHKVTV